MAPIVPRSENQSESKAKSSLVLTADAEFSSCPATSSMEMFVNCHLKAPDVSEEDRKPVDLVIVLDKSGSMHGQKLELCKETISFLARQLSSHDRLSLVCYDSEVTMEMPLILMDALGKEKILRLSKTIKTGSATNLSGGLYAGIQEIQSENRLDKGSPNTVKSVLVLTDGLANVGVTDSPSIIKMLEGCLQSNVSLFTFGYGDDHNESMLREISDVGNGVYYFVQNIDSVSLAFADCLGGLLSVVAQSVQVEITAVSAGINIQSIKTKKNVRTLVKSKRFLVELGDFYAEEERDLMVLVSIDKIASSMNNYRTVSFVVKYANVLLSDFESVSSTVLVNRPRYVKDMDDFTNSHVIQQKNRLLALDAIETASTAANSGLFVKGKQDIAEAIKHIQATLKGLSVEDQTSANCLLSDLKECQQNMVTPEYYAGRGKKRNVAKYQTHCYQRSSDIELEEEDFSNQSFSFGTSAASKGCADGYRNRSKGNMLQRAFNWKSSF